LLTGSAALRFTATGAPPAEAQINYTDESACPMADNVWNEGTLTALCFTASSAVHARVFLYDL
jgi:hypothetical protein